MSLKQKKVLFLDLQTTGAKPGSAHILEIAWNSSKSEDVESYLVHQPEGQTIPRPIQFITGIYDKDMAAAKTLSEILATFQHYLKSHWSEGAKNPPGASAFD